MTRILRRRDRVRVKATKRYGFVERITPKLRASPVLVAHSDGTSQAYAPADLWYVPLADATPEERTVEVVEQ